MNTIQNVQAQLSDLSVTVTRMSFIKSVHSLRVLGCVAEEDPPIYYLYCLFLEGRAGWRRSHI